MLKYFSAPKTPMSESTSEAVDLIVGLFEIFEEECSWIEERTSSGL